MLDSPFLARGLQVDGCSDVHYFGMNQVLGIIGQKREGRDIKGSNQAACLPACQPRSVLFEMPPGKTAMANNIVSDSLEHF
ncbi:hypothetical protein M0804_014340 [Polistes exclamans]|nr:hypothetical protein M0804_014342 [Polistes exclamans]KAI4475393.1 hypothetical protein M0804_014340 [Polistes exclamans]